MELSAHELNVDDGELDDEGDDDDDENDEDNQLYCGTCERHFSNSYSFKKHVSEHRTCGINECPFTAHEKIIEKHIIMQHTTGLYDKIRNVSTPEDIAKWIADRKRNYPTKDNVEKRYKKQEEMLKRGEKIQKNKDRFGRKNAFRLQKQQGPKNTVRKRKSNFRKKEKTQSLIDERCNWNGTLCPFRGTKELYSTPEKHEDSEFDDDEWIEDYTKSKPVAPKLRLNNALGALMGAYNSSGESDLESQENTCDIKKSNSEDEAPVEKKILRLPGQLNVENKNPLDLKNQNGHCTTKNKRKRTRHKVWGKNKKPRNDNQPPVKEKQVVTSTENKKGECSVTRKFKKRRATLLEKLLEGEIRHERNVLLQCVKFVVSNNFFETVKNDV